MPCILAVALLALASGCESPFRFEPFEPAVGPALGEMRENYAAVRLFYATDRRETGSDNPQQRFGVERSDRLRLGMGRVSIPARHGRGRLEGPALFERPSSAAHVWLTELIPAASSQRRFWSELRLAVAQSAEKQLFLFIHGYAVDFATAARRAAQIAHDTRFDGACVLYSWPSQALLLGYLTDETNLEWTQPHLVRFLERLAQESGAIRIHLMAHSMGARPLCKAIREVVRGRRESDDAEFSQIVLAASDMDAQIFTRDYAPYLTRAAERVTVYSSTNDWALLGARQLHGYARLGQWWPKDDEDTQPATFARLEVVDVTAHDRGMYGHIYYGESPRVLEDLMGIFAGKSAAERGLVRANEHFVLPAEAAGGAAP